MKVWELAELLAREDQTAVVVIKKPLPWTPRLLEKEAMHVESVEEELEAGLPIYYNAVVLS